MKGIKKWMAIILSVCACTVIAGCDASETSLSNASTPTTESGSTDGTSTAPSSEASSTASETSDSEEEFRPIQPGGNYDVGDGY